MENNNENFLEENRVIITDMTGYLTEISRLRSEIKKEEGDEPDAKRFFFRGQANSKWELVPGVFRDNMLSHECKLIQESFVRNPADFRDLQTDFEKLTKLQHYGLPTRLLDVTENPLVALFFACQSIESGSNEASDEEQQGGVVVYKREYPKSYDALDVKIISYLANQELLGDFTLEQLLLELRDNHIYTEKATDDCKKSNYKSLISILQNNYFVVSSFNNERLIRQNGAFLLCGRYNIILDKLDIGKSKIQKANSNVSDEFELKHFFIPEESKRGILEELNFCNINEGSLFPELEHQMMYIKKLKSNSSAQSIGVFSKIDPIQQKITNAGFVNLTEERQIEIIRDVVKKDVNKVLFDDCFNAICDNISIDWYRKENVLSKMRIAIANALQRFEGVDRYGAKMIAQKVMEDIVARIEEEGKKPESEY